MFARFDENPAMTLRVIKETKRYGRTDGRMDARTHGRTDNVKTVYPLQTKFAGGIIMSLYAKLRCPKVILVWFDPLRPSQQLWSCRDGQLFNLI